MGIVRGRRAGAYVNFSIGTLENGRIDDVEAISIDEDDFYYIYQVVVKNYPAFDLYDLVNPISEGKSAINNLGFGSYSGMDAEWRVL